MFFKNIKVGPIRENPIDEAIPGNAVNADAPDETLLDDDPSNDPPTEETTPPDEETEETTGDENTEETDENPFGGGDETTDAQNPELEEGDFRIKNRDKLLAEDVNNIYLEVKNLYDACTTDEDILDNKHLFIEVIDNATTLLQVVKAYRVNFKKMGYLKAKDTLLKIKSSIILIQEAVYLTKGDIITNNEE